MSDRVNPPCTVMLLLSLSVIFPYNLLLLRYIRAALVQRGFLVS